MQKKKPEALGNGQRFIVQPGKSMVRIYWMLWMNLYPGFDNSLNPVRCISPLRYWRMNTGCCQSKIMRSFMQWKHRWWKFIGLFIPGYGLD